jgi:hypothetical protein
MPADSTPQSADQSTPEELDPRTRAFYLKALDLLDRSSIPYLVGGAYSLAYHANIVRHTKDLDIFIQSQDLRRAMETFEREGYQTELTFPHWLGKVFADDAFVDLIFSSGNGLCPVDDQWMSNAVQGEVLGRKANLCPAEEIIWSKSFVQERERFDGADIAHLLLARGPTLDWKRLLRRFGPNRRILLGHLIVFGFIYPFARSNIPSWVMEDLMNEIRNEPDDPEKICRGTCLSRQQYLPDVRQWGLIDGRVQPHGPMRPQDVAHWTAAIGTIR